MIYLDNSATTKLSDKVKQNIIEMLDVFGNPSSAYDIGVKSHNIIENTRKIVAKTINCKTDEVFFTSGASESNTWALQKPFWCNDYEHHSILNNPNRVQFPDDAIIYEKMLVNNEIGFINSFDARLKEDFYVHCDGTQAMGNIDVDVKKLNVDTFSFSGHKIHAPKGVGVLYIKKQHQRLIKPLIYGGKQEKYMRGGTENIIGISALGVALEEFCNPYAIANKFVHCTKLRNIVINRLNTEFENGVDFMINQKENNIPSILSISFKNVQSESILLYLETKGIYISSGSACTTGETEPSETLRYMNIPYDFINGTIRISFTEENTFDEINTFLENLIFIVKKLQNKR